MDKLKKIEMCGRPLTPCSQACNDYWRQHNRAIAAEARVFELEGSQLALTVICGILSFALVAVAILDYVRG